MRDIFRVLLVSDLHAVNDPQDLRSTPTMNYAAGSSPRNLLAACRDAVRDAFPDGLDLLLVAGDMTNKAAFNSLALVWSDLHWLAEQLRIPIVATSGNHDYDSRGVEGAPLPNLSLMSLSPTFPFGDATDRAKYFAEHHAVFANDDVVVISANSAGHHGYVFQGAPEFEHGRYSKLLPAQITSSLAELHDLPPFRIFLTHHHPNQLPELDTEERSATIGNEVVLRTLADHGGWLVAHGHKHRGWIQYASGSGDAPPLLSSGSFSANLGEDEFAARVRHQFHVIEMERPDDGLLSGITGARGLVHSWTHSRLGWQKASAGDDLPGVTGFGWKTSIPDMARRLREVVTTETVLGREEIAIVEPRIRYMTSDDVRRLVGLLRSGLPRVEVVMSRDGLIDELSTAGDV